MVVQAIRWTGGNANEVRDFAGDQVSLISTTEQGHVALVPMIKTPEGDIKANVGDYIIKGVNGEFYPCKPEIFEKSYDIIEE